MKVRNLIDRRVIRKFISGGLAVFIGITCLPINSTSGNTIANLEQQRASLAAKTAAAKKEIEALASKQASVLEEIDAMDKVLVSLEAELSNAQSDLKTITSNLEQAEIDLDDAIDAKENQVDVLGSRLRFIQKKGSTGYFDILVEAESFGDFFLRMQYINDIMTFDRDLLIRLEEIEREIEQAKEDIEIALVAQTEIVVIEKQKVTEMNSLIGEKQSLIASYQRDEAKYEEVIKANEAADQSIIDLIKAETLKSAASSEPATVYYTGSGSLGWPVPSKAASSSSLSSGYVNRTNPVTGSYESHKGYDIPASYGSNIVAAEAGKIIHSGWMNGYGNTIVIDHGGGLTTLYAHNSSLTVSKGDVVTRGQTVAKCGSTGMSTGNHLHFSVLVNGAYQNPESYLGVGNVGY